MGRERERESDSSSSSSFNTLVSFLDEHHNRVMGEKIKEVFFSVPPNIGQD